MKFYLLMLDTPVSFLDKAMDNWASAAFTSVSVKIIQILLSPALKNDYIKYRSCIFLQYPSDFDVEPLLTAHYIFVMVCACSSWPNITFSMHIPLLLNYSVIPEDLKSPLPA
jgi:hypothetical protein